MSANIIKCCFLLLFSAISVKMDGNEIKLLSPDKKTEVSFFDSQTGDVQSVKYKVGFLGKEVILPSSLGVIAKPLEMAKVRPFKGDWTKGTKLDDVIYSSCDTVWKPVYGERSIYTDKYNQAIITILSDKGLRMQLIAKVYNEGVAFSYKLIESSFAYVQFNKDGTTYSMPVGTKAWYAKHAQGEYSLLPLDKGWLFDGERPLTMKLTNGIYVCLGEAGVVDFVRTKFKVTDEMPDQIQCSMYGPVDQIIPYQTPWHVIMIAEKPGTLLENNFIFLNLNKPCTLSNTQWIKPGKAMRETTLSTKGAIELVDFAVKRNIDYIHFDAGWYGNEYSKESDATQVRLDPRRNPIIDALDLPKVINYAKSKGKKVMLYVNQRALEQQLDTLLPLFEKWGVDGIKFGFVQVGSQHWTTWLHEAVKKCALHHLVVDIHDEYRPTGFSRTYPNLLSQEGIRGNEEFPDATNNVILPFTRFVAGAADYTVCYYKQNFDRRPVKVNERFLKNTSAHQLALPVVFYSPLQFMYWYDKPSDCRDEPELEFFDALPTTWDDTKVVQGEIGEYITVARRKGNEWFVGTMNNTLARKLDIPLSFLETGKKYVAQIYSDDEHQPTRTKVRIDRMIVDSGTIIKVFLKGSDGQAMRLIEATTDEINNLPKYAR